MKTISIDQPQLLNCEGAETRNWYAWLDTMPPKPDHLYATGQVQVPNPGVHALLRRKEPQGINPEILLLDLFLIQNPGLWPQIVTWVPARYEEVVAGNEAYTYKEVSIFCGEEIIAQIPVEIVS